MESARVGDAHGAHEVVILSVGLTKEDIHHGYLDIPSTPLFAFGHGLSYTTFEYSPLKLGSDSVDVSGEARVSLTITNTGKRRGTEIVQLYAADTATGVTLPAQQFIEHAVTSRSSRRNNDAGDVANDHYHRYKHFTGTRRIE